MQKNPFTFDKVNYKLIQLTINILGGLDPGPAPSQQLFKFLI